MTPIARAVTAVGLSIALTLCATESITRGASTGGRVATGRVAASGWSALQSDVADNLSDISCPRASLCYAVGDNATILRSADGGATWSHQPNPAQRYTFSIASIACPASNICYAGEDFLRVLGTTDGGRTWVQLADGLNDVYDTDRPNLYAMACPSVRHCYTGGGRGYLYETADGGAHWSTLPSSTSDVILALSCPNDTTCYGGAGFWCNGFWDGCLQSQQDSWLGGTALDTKDGGRSWKAASGNVSVFGMSCPAVNVCVAAATGNVLARTTDGGKHFVSLHSPLPAGTAYGTVSCTSVQVCHVIASTRKGPTVVATSDGGHTWRSESIPTQQGLQSINCPAQGTCYAVGGRGVILKGW